MNRNRVLFAAACLVLAGLIALFTIQASRQVGDAQPVRATGVAAVGGPFQLVDQDGRATTEQMLKGKWTVVFFGFTFCPDVCPTTLQTLAAAQDQLGPKADRLQIVFVSLDPARDTPAAIKTYLGNQGFPKGVVGLTGTPEQVAAAAKAYRVYWAKSGEGDDYLIDHSTPAYLMSPKGQFVRVLAYGQTPSDIARQITEAMREG